MDTKNKKNVKKTATKKKVDKVPAKKKIVKEKEVKSTLNSKIITENIEEEKTRKYNNVIIMALLFVFAIILLVFLTNKTFFRNSYNNGDINIKLPLFIYFVSDEDNVITLKTLRKSEYIRSYFDEHLSNLEEYDFYNCNNGRTVYYNPDTGVAIYDIDIQKNIAIKTIKIEYGIKTPATICE